MVLRPGGIVLNITAERARLFPTMGIISLGTSKSNERKQNGKNKGTRSPLKGERGEVLGQRFAANFFSPLPF